MFRHALRLAFCLAVTLAAPHHAWAQSPETVTAARELIVTMRATEQMKALLPIIMQSVKPAIAQGRPEVERALEDILPPVLAEAEAHLDELADQMAAVYANHFTPAELNEMTAFYRSATGQKLVEKTPVVAQQSMAIGQKFGQAMFERSRGRIIEELRKKGHKI